MRHAVSVALAMGIAVTSLALPAAADVTQTDLLIAGRAIGFIRNLKQGDIRVGIVYDPDAAQSAQQANELDVLMRGGLSVGNLVLKPVMVPIGQLENTQIDLFFLAEGIGGGAEHVKDVSRARKIPCITYDLSEVRNGSCAIGVQSDPRIEVFVNREAADASGMDLAAAFRIMISEI